MQYEEHQKEHHPVHSSNVEPSPSSGHCRNNADVLDAISTDRYQEELLGVDSPLLRAAQTIARAVQSLPTSGEVKPAALLIGGFVRDIVVGSPSKDLDLEVHGVEAGDLEGILEELFPGRVNSVGRSFQVFKVSLSSECVLDVSIPRVESKVGLGHGGFEVAGMPHLGLVEAARRRDFTMNALAADPLTGVVYDPFDGLAHIERGILVATDPERFRDDPLRVYRAVQLAARFQLTLSPNTHELLLSMVDDGELALLSPERVTEEISKILLKAERPSHGFELMRELGIIQRYFPEFERLCDTPQDPTWHPEGNVWIHTMMVLDQAAKGIREPDANLNTEQKLEIMLGALCHDLGKPDTTAVKNGRWTAHGHEFAGLKPTDVFFDKLSFPKKVQESVERMVLHHMRPGVLERTVSKKPMDSRIYRNEVRKILRDVYPTSFEVFLRLCESDTRGRGGASPDANYNSMRKTVSEFSLSHEALIGGRDLIGLGLQPGVRFGSIIAEVCDRQDRGKIETKEDALRFVRLNRLIDGEDLKRLAELSPREIGRRMSDVKNLVRAGRISTREEFLKHLTAQSTSPGHGQ